MTDKIYTDPSERAAVVYADGHVVELLTTQEAVLHFDSLGDVDKIGAKIMTERGMVWDADLIARLHRPETAPSIATYSDFDP